MYPDNWLITTNKPTTTHFLITDHTVDTLYASTVVGAFGTCLRIKKIVVPDGERAKSFEHYRAIVDGIIAAKPTRDSIIFTLGGGVVNNLGGFTAATVFRGMQLVHIPTTFMAQVDAALDIRQGINVREGKNLLGSMYSPTHVLICPEFLRTQCTRQLHSGLAEAIKHAIFQDEELFRFMEQLPAPPYDFEVVKQILQWAINLKLETFSWGRGDYSEEMGPQYGHAFGHAIEAASGYTMLHGEAISIGMCLSAEVAGILGIASDAVISRQYNILRKNNLPTTIPPDISLESIMAQLYLDKHWCEHGARMGLVGEIGFLDGIGENCMRTVSESTLRIALEAHLKRQIPDLCKDGQGHE